jgi:hypothetical protein
LLATTHLLVVLVERLITSLTDGSIDIGREKMTTLLTTMTFNNNERVDFFKKADGFYWQSTVYREDDGYFVEPGNGPFANIKEAVFEAREILA